MATWKKVIVSGSNADLLTVSASIFYSSASLANGTTGFVGTASYAVTAAFAANVSSPVFSITGSAITNTSSFSANGDQLRLIGTNGFTASLTDNITITTASFGFPTTAQVQLGAVTGSLLGTASWADNTTNSNKILTVQDGTAAQRYLTFVDSDNASPGTYESLYTDAGISYNPSTNDLTISGDLGVNGGDITTSATTATVFNTNATTVNAFGAATTLTIGNNGTNAAITIGSATSTASFGGNVVIAGGLDVNGTVTTIDTQNLLVADRFILLASGSTTAGEGGIIVQQATNGAGELFGWDNDTSRWAVTGSYTATGTTFTPDAFMAAAIIGAGTDPTLTVTRYNKGGNIFVGTDGNIWIYS